MSTPTFRSGATISTRCEVGENPSLCTSASCHTGSALVRQQSSPTADLRVPSPTQKPERGARQEKGGNRKQVFGQRRHLHDQWSVPRTMAAGTRTVLVRRPAPLLNTARPRAMRASPNAATPQTAAAFTSSPRTKRRHCCPTKRASAAGDRRQPHNTCTTAGALTSQRTIEPRAGPPEPA